MLFYVVTAYLSSNSIISASSLHLLDRLSLHARHQPWLPALPTVGD